MTRVIRIKNVLGSDDKYVLRDEYNGFGIYQEKTPSGYFVSQSWLLKNDNVTIMCESYNNKCKEELLDAIDSYKNRRRFGFKAFYRNGCYVVHPNGDRII